MASTARSADMTLWTKSRHRAPTRTRTHIQSDACMSNYIIYANECGIHASNTRMFAIDICIWTLEMHLQLPPVTGHRGLSQIIFVRKMIEAHIWPACSGAISIFGCGPALHCTCVQCESCKYAIVKRIELIFCANYGDPPAIDAYWVNLPVLKIGSICSKWTYSYVDFCMRVIAHMQTILELTYRLVSIGHRRPDYCLRGPKMVHLFDKRLAHKRVAVINHWNEVVGKSVTKWISVEFKRYTSSDGEGAPASDTPFHLWNAKLYRRLTHPNRSNIQKLHLNGWTSASVAYHALPANNFANYRMSALAVPIRLKQIYGKVRIDKGITEKF